MNVDTTPDGFYAVCPIRRGDVAGYFWAAWWTAGSSVLVEPRPDTHGIVDDRRLAHERARAVIIEAKGPRASILQLDTVMAIEAARIVRPAAEGYRTGESARAEEQSSERPGRERARTPRVKWLTVLGLTWPCTIAEARKAYRRLARERHPDRGGTDAAFDELTKAYEAAITEIEMASHRRQ